MSTSGRDKRRKYSRLSCAGSVFAVDFTAETLLIDDTRGYCCQGFVTEKNTPANFTGAFRILA